MQSMLDQIRSQLIDFLDVIPPKSEMNTSAAVLVPLVNDTEGWKLLFTRRTAQVNTHKNEVSFPGGTFEQEDRTLLNTALRETWEEIGVVTDDISIIGRLPKVTTIHGISVYPFVGIINWPVDLVLNKNEVETVFMIPLDWLTNKENTYEIDHVINDIPIRRVVHYNNYNGEHLWGFTARITQQIVNMIK
jgi:8-oxo-dGTP pyrophosphatase MutT (NUDIX family)